MEVGADAAAERSEKCRFIRKKITVVGMINLRRPGDLNLAKSQRSLSLQETMPKTNSQPYAQLYVNYVACTSALGKRALMLATTALWPSQGGPEEARANDDPAAHQRTCP